MSDSIRPGEFRICPSCGSRNKAAHNFCVRCSGSMDAAITGGARGAAAVQPRNPRLMRFLIAGGVIAAVGAGFVVHTVLRATEDAQTITEDVRADSARTIDTPAPPPPLVTGWSPGAGLPDAPEASSAAGGIATRTWSSDSFPVARPNPYDVPGDPGASMVGIAPRAPRARAAMKRQRVFTDNDLLATRGTGWSPPAPVSTGTQMPHVQAPSLSPENEEVAKRASKLRIQRSRVHAAEARLAELRARGSRAVDEDALDDATEEAEDARKDAAKAARELEETRRRN